MKKRLWHVLLVGVVLFSSSIVCFAGMESKSYRIQVSVQSGGGAFMKSAKYQNESTLGQPTPLMSTANPPCSKGYALYPGFWYTLGEGDQGSEGQFYLIPNKKGGAAVIYLE